MAAYKPRHLIHALLLLAAPVVLVLVVLVAGGYLAAAPALIAGAVAVAATGLLLGGHFRDLAKLRRYVHSLRTDWTEEAPPPPLPEVVSPGLAPELTGAIAESIHERHVRRQELRAAMAGTEAVLAGLPDPLLLLDADCVIRDANPAARRLFPGDIHGHPLAIVLRQPDLLEAVEQVLHKKQGAEVEFVVHGPVDRSYIARIAPLPATGPGGTIAVVALHEVTAIRRAEQMRADFVANASHELRTPLSSLLGFVETLQGPAKDDPDAHAQFLAIMHDQAKRMSNLIEDLLSLSRIELDEHSPPTGRTDLRDLLERVADAVSMQAAERGMTIELELPDGPLEVRGDRQQLAQVFQNLVDNAVKYGRDTTPVRIEVAQAGAANGRPARCGPGSLAVSVIDQGEGIARSHIPRLTERFYRADTARSRNLGGTGLGLAIVKHIVNRHRGQLDIASSPGEGSRFTVTLPPATPDTAQARMADAETQPAARQAG